MARALLVDDEKNIRNGLRAIISRTDSVFTDIDESINGIDALQKLSYDKYDLVITDLIMPQVDGIELVAKIDSMAYKPYTVVLSGHDDFKYAQKAIAYGVKAYLLKPVNRNDVINIVKKAEAELAKKLNTWDVSQEILKTELFENQLKLIVLSDNISSDEAERLLCAGKMNIIGGSFRISVLNSTHCYASGGKRENNKKLAAGVQKYLSQTKTPGCCFLDNNDNVIAILDKSMDLRSIIEFVNNSYGFRCTAGTGDFFGSANEMKLSYKQADFALKHIIFANNQDILDFSQTTLTDNKGVVPVRMVKSALSMLETERRDELCSAVRRIFDEGVREKHSLEYFEKLSHLVRDEIVRYLSEYLPHKPEYIEETEKAFKSLYRFESIKGYIDYVVDFIVKINDALLQFKSTRCSDKTIDMAVKYVQENYRKDLTMAEVANHTSLNYSYFSLLFKEKTGMNFVDYLRMIRIEKAKELLKNSIYKIYEISERVGYSNTKHFTTTFRALTGISPKEYREKLYIN
ncbi:MAG TPA: response regulator [Ruminiclostridium sp.]|nr:response regulator [Ruminiclostridium sp.]